MKVIKFINKHGSTIMLLGTALVAYLYGECKYIDGRLDQREETVEEFKTLKREAEEKFMKGEEA